MMRDRRAFGRCVLCGKPVWGSFKRHDNGIRHTACQPGKNGLRYGVADQATERGSK
jgi:hypothetical protein